jgi:hypothetical protein
MRERACRHLEPRGSASQFHEPRAWSLGPGAFAARNLPPHEFVMFQIAG